MHLTASKRLKGNGKPAVSRQQTHFHAPATASGHANQLMQSKQPTGVPGDISWQQQCKAVRHATQQACAGSGRTDVICGHRCSINVVFRDRGSRFEARRVQQDRFESVLHHPATHATPRRGPSRHTKLTKIVNQLVVLQVFTGDLPDPSRRCHVHQKLRCSPGAMQGRLPGQVSWHPHISMTGRTC